MGRVILFVGHSGKYCLIYTEWLSTWPYHVNFDFFKTIHSIMFNHYLLLGEFFPLALTGGFSLEFERQQNTSSFHDSSRCSGSSKYGWSELILLFPSLPVLLPILLELFQIHQPQFVSTSTACFVFFKFSNKV